MEQQQKNLKKKHIPKSLHPLENCLLKIRNRIGQKSFYFSSTSEEGDT